MTCPPYQGLIVGSAAHTYTLAILILYILYSVISLAVYNHFRKTTLFLSKRSFPLIICSTIGHLAALTATVIYDYFGPANWPCGLFTFLIYVMFPLSLAPTVLKRMNYLNKVLRVRVLLELQAEKGKMASLSGEISFKALFAHLRVAFCHSRTKEDRILNAKFGTSKALPVLWIGFVFFSFLTCFFIRLATDPVLYNGCTSCELSNIDSGILIGVCVLNLLIGINGTPLRPDFKRDPLLINRESGFILLSQIPVAVITFSLLIADPGNVNANGMFSWRSIYLTGPVLVIFIEQWYVLYHSRRSQMFVIASDEFNTEDRFQEIMANPKLKQDLRMDLNNELSGEILAFLDTVDHYKNFTCVNESLNVIVHEKNLIFENFIKKYSPFEVNISDQDREAIEKEMVDDDASGELPHNLVFDKAYLSVRRELLRDGFQRYLSLKKQEALNQVTVAHG